MTVLTSALQQESAATVSERVLAAIAAREQMDPLNFERRLYDVIDPDALDALFQSNGMNGQVTFTYLGYEVTVHNDTEISLHLMSEKSQTDSEFSDLPFHEYCAHCKQQFDETILDPSVTIVETEDERALHAFCDEECLSEWTGDAQ